MLEVFFSPVFFNSVHQMVDYVVTIAIYMFTVGVIFYFLAMVMRLSTGRENSDVFYHLFFVAFSAIGLATYKIWAVWLGKLFVLLARAIFDLEADNLMAEYLGAFFADEDGGLKFSLFNLMSLETLSSLSYLLVMIVYEIFVIIQVIVQIFFYILGPIAIVLSLFPQFHDIFKTWLMNFCAVNFWSVLVAILFRLGQNRDQRPGFSAITCQWREGSSVRYVHSRGSHRRLYRAHSQAFCWLYSEPPRPALILGSYGTGSNRRYRDFVSLAQR